MSMEKLYLTRYGVFFGGIEPREGREDYIVIGVPLDVTTTYVPGTRFGPKAIREASENIEFFSILKNIDLEEFFPLDLGDIVLTPDISVSLARIEYMVKNIAARYSSPIVILGGEHTITYAAIRGILGAGLKPCMLVFDAHFDIRNEYLGSSINHATVMRRIIETYASKALYFIGVRAFSREELDYVREKNIPYITPIDIWKYGIRDAIRKTRNWLSTSNCDTLYVSIDMDVFDPAYAPGVGNPEPNGLEPWMMLSILSDIIYEDKRRLMLDIVEVNPLRDCNNITSILASKCILEALAAYFSRK